MERCSERFVFVICLLSQRLGKSFPCCFFELLPFSLTILLGKLVKLQLGTAQEKNRRTWFVAAE